MRHALQGPVLTHGIARPEHAASGFTTSCDQKRSRAGSCRSTATPCRVRPACHAGALLPCFCHRVSH
jgi:hypothetical protein